MLRLFFWALRFLTQLAGWLLLWPFTWLRRTTGRILPMTDSEVTYDWNGETIHFNQWDDNALGLYDYMTRDRRHLFQFELRKIGQEVRIYIVNSPSYEGRTGDTHRLNDSRGDYVCVRSDLKPTNVPDALSWMVYWAEETGKFIDTGNPFS